MQQNNKNNIEDIFELAPLQQGILFHALYSAHSSAYIDQFCYNLTGNLNEDNFKRAWEEIVRRHGIFRTSFQWKGISKPVQIVNREAELSWKSFDWSGKSVEEQENEFNSFLKMDRSDLFSFEKAPLMRCTLIKLSDETYKFVWTFQHILMDGWSYPIIQKEVFTVYESLIKGIPHNLQRPLSYKQFILWLNQQDKNSAERFWRKELSGFDSPTQLNAYDTVKEPGPEEVKELDLILNEALTNSLQNFARQNQITLNTIIQGAWANILSTYSGEQDVLFGGTVSGRNPDIKGVDTMAGLFINTLPVRIKADKTEALIPWLKKIQENHIERDQYSYSSLVDIQEWSEIPRGTQMFENILVFENYPLDKSFENGIAGIKINNLKAFERTNFPLTIVIAPGENLAVKFIYETSKYETEFIEQVLQNFKTFLENVSLNPERRISEIPVLTEKEANKILYEWNDTKVTYPDSKPVHELFRDQVKRTPDSVAIEFEDRQMTYSELDVITDKIANYLINAGVKPETIAGICIDRSLEMITGLLGILKAGGAYVPIDPSYPQERIDYMIQDSGIKILLTSKNHKEKIINHNAEVVFLDDENKFSSESSVPPEVKLTPENMVYVIYTSGSTGNPKGVINIHKGLTNQILWIKDYLRCSQEDVVLQKTSFSFDVSTFELFMPLICGAKLVFAVPDGHKNNAYLIDVVNRKKITIIHFVTSMLAMFLEEKGADKCTSLRLFVSSGEEVTLNVQNLFFRKFPDTELHDLYGPTETSVHVTYWKCDKHTKLNTVPIGKPVANTQAYVLDMYCNPVPAGVAGELHIGGDQVARGYHGRDELTLEKFIPDKFSDKEGAKIYKTGDLVRFMKDGNIEYFGRKDNQIKLRGFRIELGEIENAISHYPGIRLTVVIAKDYHDGDKRLIAYIVTEDNNAFKIPELKNHLQTKLPVFMLPSEFVLMDEIPLTGSGKVNKKALPEPEFIRANESTNYSEPKDTLELQLVKIWEKVIGKRPIGIKDNFFELGGHSLLALRLFGYIEKLTGKKLPLSTLFSYPTIEQLAVILKDEGWKPQWKSLVAVKPGGSRLPFFYIPPAAGTALEVKDLIKYLPDNQPFYILESVGLDGKEPPHTEIEQMSVHFVKEIQSLQPEGPYLIGGRCFGGRVAFDVAQQLTKQGQKIALLSIFDTWPPFTEKPVDHIPQKRDSKHFISSTIKHIRTGEFFKVAYNYSSNEIKKLIKNLKNKYDDTFSSERKKIYNHIRQIHFKAQDRYIAKKFPGKITLIECEATKTEYRKRWESLAGGGLEFYVIPGTDHKSIVREPKLREFVEKLNFVLDKTHREVYSINESNGSAGNVFKKVVT
ncbi:MAG: amino acid adenylation domain-containing protein [Ignavibacteria bacterium]|nr:amino acid adenylation domain-containing protein [Ignavibacteria bacterium]